MDDTTNGADEQTPMIASKKSKGTIIAWILVVLLLISTVAGFGLYLVTKQEKEEALTQLTSEQLKLQETEEKLSKAVLLPAGTTYEPLCGSDNNNTRLAQVNTTPINGYNLYVASCLNEVSSQNFSGTKIIGFEVSEGGEQTTAFVVGQGEPFCVPGSKILAKEDSTAISKATGLPVCQG